MPVHFHPEARRELLEAAGWYETQQPGLRGRFLAAAEDAVRRAEALPFLCTAVSDDIRQCRVRRFPYGVIFRPVSEGIEVLAVMHLHREPGYWRHRLRR